MSVGVKDSILETWEKKGHIEKLKGLNHNTDSNSCEWMMKGFLRVCRKDGPDLSKSQS